MRVSSTFFSSPPSSIISSSSPRSSIVSSSYSPPSLPSSDAPPLPFKPRNLRAPPIKTRFAGEDEVMYISFCDE